MPIVLYRLLYTLIWIAALPAVLLRLCWRARLQPAYLQQLGERFGHYPVHLPAPTLWLHAVSVGETRAAEPLIRALLAHYPAHTLVLTHMTPTGKETAAALFGNEARIASVYLPYDLGILVGRFLNHFRPEIGIMMETELWPTLLQRCEHFGIPVTLANGRLSSRSASRYARLPAFSKALLSSLSIASQTDEDAARFTALGAKHVTVTGNIKFDIEPPEVMLERARQFRARIGSRPVILAASTRDGEEALLLEAFISQAPADVLLVLVARHPHRFDMVAQQVHAHRLTLQRRSDETAVAADTRVWLGDSMGEMFAYYAAADIALIGGSWLAFGGQNLIESCAVGTPVVIGPHTFNFSQAAAQAISCGAAIRAADATLGMQAALSLLHDAKARKRMGQAGKDFAAAHRGATARTLALIDHIHSAPDEIR